MSNLNFTQMAELVERWAEEDPSGLDARPQILTMALYLAASHSEQQIRAFADDQPGTEYEEWLDPMINLYGVPEDKARLRSAFRTILDVDLRAAWDVWVDDHTAQPDDSGFKQFLTRAAVPPKPKP